MILPLWRYGLARAEYARGAGAAPGFINKQGLSRRPLYGLKDNP